MIDNRPGIYKITNTFNSKVYIGSSQNVRKRRNNHFSDLKRNKHKSIHLQNSYNKYGDKYFVFDVIEYIENTDDLLNREAYWIEEYKANDRKFGYNSRIYVDSCRGTIRSKETRMKISKAKKGVKLGKFNISQEMRKLKSERCKLQNLSQYHTEEVENRRKINSAKALKERGCPEYHKIAISQSNRGSGNGMSKLNEGDVIEIKKLLSEGVLTQQKIADMFNISRRTIGSIKDGKTWGHIKINLR